MKKSGNFKPLIGAGLLLGMGLGGLGYGILMHQVLHQHNLFSGPIGDGLFYSGTWAITFLGLCYLWSITKRIDVPHSNKGLTGGMLLGWGIFNFFEGIINHQVLKLHHLIPDAPDPERLYYDMAFLGLALLQIFLGRLIIKKAKKDFKIFEFSEPITERTFS